jgi:hypothetical protein
MKVNNKTTTQKKSIKGYDFDPREDIVGSSEKYVEPWYDPHAELERNMMHEKILSAKKGLIDQIRSETEKSWDEEFPQYEYEEYESEEYEPLKKLPKQAVVLASEEDQKAINDLQSRHPEMFGSLKKEHASSFYPNEAWIQTHTRARFTPTKPMVQAIDLEDIAHSLSLQCRFAGHCSEFYSVAQHSVLVSYLCGVQDALWGLMHDASEAYLVDVPRPLKISGKFDKYLEFEKNMQDAICERFHLPKEEPISVKVADQIALATEVRDLMGGPRPDWTLEFEPFPAKIIPLSPKEAKELFLKRFAFLK